MKIITNPITLLALAFATAMLANAFPASAGEYRNLCEYHTCSNKSDDGQRASQVRKSVNQGIAVAAATDTYVVDPSKDFHLNLNYANGDWDNGTNAVGISAGYLIRDHSLFLGGAVASSVDGDVQVIKGTVGLSF